MLQAGMLVPMQAMRARPWSGVFTLFERAEDEEVAGVPPGYSESAAAG